MKSLKQWTKEELINNYRRIDNAVNKMELYSSIDIAKMAKIEVEILKRGGKILKEINF